MLLSNERVQRGLSQEVANRLLLSRKQLEAIENDEYDKLPGPAFARGFVPAYAKLLGLDVALLNASLDAPSADAANPPVTDAAPAAPAPAASSRSSTCQSHPDRGALALLVLLLATGVGYRLLPLQGASTPATPPLAAPAVDSAPAGRAES